MNRVKSLSKSGNPRKDQVPNPAPQTNKEISSTSSIPASASAEDFNYQRQEKTMDIGRKFVERENSSYSSAATAADKQPLSFSSNYLSNGREEKGLPSASLDRERFEPKNSYGDTTSQKMNSYSQIDTGEKLQKVSPPRRKGSKDEKSERPANWMKRDANGSDTFTTNSKQQSTGNYNTVSKDEKSDRPSNWMKRDSSSSDLFTTSSKQQSTGNYAPKDEKSERPANWMKRDASNSDIFSTSLKQPSTGNYNNVTTGSRPYEAESSPNGNINAVLEVCQIYGNTCSLPIFS